MSFAQPVENHVENSSRMWETVLEKSVERMSNTPKITHMHTLFGTPERTLRCFRKTAPEMTGNMFADKKSSQNKQADPVFPWIQPVYRIISYFFLRQPIRTVLRAVVS